MAKPSDVVLVERQVNAAWSPEGDAHLVFVSRYETTDNSEPHFNATKATNWHVSIERASPTGRAELASWPDPAAPGGGVAYEAQFWLPSSNSVVGMEYNRPYVLDITTGERTFAFPPQAALERAVGTGAASSVAARNAVPSPDGCWLAVSLILAESGNSEIDISFTHLVAMFDLRDGVAFERLDVVPFSDRTLDLRLAPPVEQIPFVWTFLWNRESSGIFSISFAGSEAFFVPITGETSPVDKVPALAVPTRGGLINDAGEAAVSVLSGNDATIESVDIADWVPFTDIELILLAEINYAL
ncbi:MAG: hypothetical protein GY798_01675 [Hyphomicrobiales bacterium]|nr:hypothetical protein [Hyphomicrobiales bacterium]